MFASPGTAATAPLPYPRRPRHQGARRAHLVRPPAGRPRRPARARSSEPGLNASSPAARSPLPAPARAALRLTRASSGESLAAAARLLGAVVAGAGVAGARGGGCGGGATEGPAHQQTQGTLPGPASTAAPRIPALDKRPGMGRAPGDGPPPLPPHAHPWAPRAADLRVISQIQPQVNGGRPDQTRERPRDHRDSRGLESRTPLFLTRR